MGACKSCTSQAPPDSEIQHPKSLAAGKRTIVHDIKTILESNGFTKYQLLKSTQHQLNYSGVYRQIQPTHTKVINSFGTVLPINLENLRKANTELRTLRDSQVGNEVILIDKEMTFKCGLALQEPMPQLQLNILLAEHTKLQLESDKYTLIRTWNQGEQMVNFEHAIDLAVELQIKLVGIVRGVEEQCSVYEELIRSNDGWKQHQHIMIVQDDINSQAQIFDIHFNDELNDVEEGNVVSALLFYGDKLIWKRYLPEWDIASDSDEVAVEVKQIVHNRITDQRKSIKQVEQSNFAGEDYRSVKQFIKSQQTSAVISSRDVKISISKRTLYTDEKKQVNYQSPEFAIATSLNYNKETSIFLQKFNSTTNVQQSLTLWNKGKLIQKLTDLIQKHKLNIVICLEKTIRFKCNYEDGSVIVTPWEQALLQPQYKSTQYITQVKQWIEARDQLMPELEIEIQNSTEIAQKQLNQMCYNFFRNIPSVTLVMNQQYGRIPYAEKRKPPYEDMMVSKSLGTEEIGRKDGQILFILLIDYENDDTLELLQQLVAYKEQNQQLNNLQIAVLGHIRAESWTRLFQAYMDKNKLSASAINGTIETWFPVEDKIGSISFSAILSKMYGMQLEKRDCMIIDKDNVVRVIDMSRKVVPNIINIIQSLSTKAQPYAAQGSYQKQWQGFKKCIRENSGIKEICQDIKKNCKDDDNILIIEQKAQTLWDFEGDNVSRQKKYQQPWRQIRGNIQSESLTKILSKYVDERDVIPMIK